MTFLVVQVDMPKSNTAIIQTSILERYVVRCGSKKQISKRHVFERDWTKCSKYAKHSKFNNQHDLEDMYDHLMSTRNFTLIINNLFIMSFIQRLYEKI